MTLRRYDCVYTTVLVTRQYHRARHEVASGVRTPITATETLHTLHSAAALNYTSQCCAAGSAEAVQLLYSICINTAVSAAIDALGIHACASYSPEG
jgi:hypothetical protein